MAVCGVNTENFNQNGSVCIIVVINIKYLVESHSQNKRIGVSLYVL